MYHFPFAFNKKLIIQNFLLPIHITKLTNSKCYFVAKYCYSIAIKAQTWISVDDSIYSSLYLLINFFFWNFPGHLHFASFIVLFLTFLKYYHLSLSFAKHELPWNELRRQTKIEFLTPSKAIIMLENFFPPLGTKIKLWFCANWWRCLKGF